MGGASQDMSKIEPRVRVERDFAYHYWVPDKGVEGALQVRSLGEGKTVSVLVVEDGKRSPSTFTIPQAAALHRALGDFLRRRMATENEGSEPL